MHAYINELEKLITEELLPVYLEHYRLLGRPAPTKKINAKLINAMRAKRKVCRLLERDSYV